MCTANNGIQTNTNVLALLFDKANYAFNLSALPNLLTGITILVLGAITLVREHGSRVAVPFALLSLTLSLWMLGFAGMYLSTRIEVVHWWSQLGHIGITFIPAAVFHFTVQTIGGFDRYRYFAALLAGISSVMAISCIATPWFLGMPQQFWWGYYPSHHGLGNVFIFYLAATLSWCIFMFLKTSRTSPSGSTMEIRARLLFIAASVGSLSGLDLLPAHGVVIPPMGYVPLLCLFGLITYVTWRYRLVDITSAFAGQQIVDTMPDALLVLDRDGLIQLCNPVAAEMLGQPAETLINKSVLETRARNFFSDNLEALLDGKKISRIEHGLGFDDGDERTISVSASTIRDRGNYPTAFVFVLADVTERKQAERKIRHLAYFDDLTQLPNRTQFNEKLTQMLVEARASKRRMTLFFLDIDRFKRINDTLGHSAGDQLLCAVANRLTGCIRRCDFLRRDAGRDAPDSLVARLGGDEFIVALSDIARVSDVSIVAQRMLDGLAEPFRIADHEMFVSASIGISMYPNDGVDSQALLKNADVAMYHAKDAGRNNYQFYEASMNAAMHERLALESDLRKALELNQFELHYQPQIDYRANRVVGTEALLRWRHPERGFVSPLEFIPLAEESGLIPAIGAWVLRNACRQNQRWQQLGMGPMHIAVNLSERQFRQVGLEETVAQALNESGMRPDLLDLELTESIIMEDAGRTIDTLKSLKQMGVKVSVDDFGTGYSSLSYLKKFPIDVIKIDQSFVRDVTIDADNAALTQAIIAMARNLGLDVIAEGVETVDEAHFLVAHDCYLMQGYLFGKPSDAKTLGNMLSRGAYNVDHQMRGPAAAIA